MNWTVYKGTALLSSWYHLHKATESFWVVTRHALNPMKKVSNQPILNFEEWIEIPFLSSTKMAARKVAPLNHLSLNVSRNGCSTNPPGKRRRELSWKSHFRETEIGSEQAM
jgi:hypothetical protein